MNDDDQVGGQTSETEPDSDQKQADNDPNALNGDNDTSEATEDQHPTNSLDEDNDTSEATEDQHPTITVTTDDTSNTLIKPSLAGRDADPNKPAPGVNYNKQKNNLVKSILVLVVVIVLAAVGYLLAGSFNSKPSKNVSVKKDIPDLTVTFLQPLHINMYPNIRNELTNLEINAQIFQGLTKVINGTQIVPNLATSWTNPNQSTWIFNLRPNVKFHTGKTMTAYDVKASIDAVASTSWGQTFASTIKDVKVLGPLKVEIDTNAPDPILLNKLTDLYIFDTTSGKADNSINGTGPYQLVSNSTNDVRLKAFNGYWGGHVYVKQVDYMGEWTNGEEIPPSMLAAHQPQVIGVTADPGFVNTLKSYGYNISYESDYAVGELIFNSTTPGSPLSKLAVRKAITEAINKPAIINASGNTGSPVANQLIAQGIPGYNPAIQPSIFSDATAKTDLANAGYPNGFSFTFTYFNAPNNQGLANELKTELAKIGVTVNLDPESDVGFFNKLANNSSDMYYAVINSNYLDGSDILADYVGVPYYNNATFNKLNTQASTMFNQTKRLQLLQQASSVLANDYAGIPLFQRTNEVVATAPNLVIFHDTAASEPGTYIYHDYQK